MIKTDRAPSSLKQQEIMSATEQFPVRVVTRGHNYFDVFRNPTKGYSVKSKQNGGVYVAYTISEVKFYIGYSL